MPAAPAQAAEGPVMNSQEFEWREAFGEDYTQRWSRGPNTQAEDGKPIRQALINAILTKYPSNPKESRPCLQLVGGQANAPCTGIWTSFAPLIRPTEIEFEFTMNGKVDMPNACVVLTEKAFDSSLPDAIVGLQFMARGGMQLVGGTGGIVRISNDGKIKNDKYSKVLLKIDWNEKVVIGQVDSTGRGYAPAMQTVPFRDARCEGFSHLYIYNTDVQATCWFSWLRVKQGPQEYMDDGVREGLDARAYFREREKKKEYQRAVDADMEVGMKMGAIKSTKEHGMNLAQEQRANNSGAGVM